MDKTPGQNFQEKVCQYLSLAPLLEAHVKKNTVLIIEPTDWHGEILPSVVNYLLEMGFSVDVVVTDRNFMNDLFSELKFNKSRLRIFHVFSAASIREHLFGRIMLRYKYILLTSTDDFTGMYFPDVMRKKYSEQYLKNNIYHIEHQWSRFKELVNESDIDYFANRAFVLHETILDNKFELPLISPTKFGKVQSKQKNKITNFITIGRLTKDCRNFDSLIDAVENLLSKGINNFHVDIVGRLDGDVIDNRLYDYHKNISISGTLTNKQIYRKLHESDFVLALLDPECDEHKNFYIKHGTSGTFGTAIGFLKPIVINDVFADSYGLDRTNTLIYENNSLSDAMESAIKMPKSNYLSMVKALSCFKKKQEQKSMNNIKKVLSFS